MIDEGKRERLFWRCWLGGLTILALMIAVNPWLVSDAAPWGIRDHQSAASGARVDVIQTAWQAMGTMNFARWSIALDLVYIAIYSLGAYCGGRIFSGSKMPTLRWIGWLVMIAAVVLGIADYAETISQFIQAMQFKGDDLLAGIAATAQPIKSTAFLITFFGIFIGLVIRRLARRA